MSDKPYDKAFKFLAEQDAESLLILIGAIRPNQHVTIERLPNEVSVTAHLPDQLYRVITAHQPRIIHVEAQTVYDPNIPQRMTNYALRLWLKYGVPIDSYVLLLTRRNLPSPAPTEFTVQAGSLTIHLRFHLVRLWDISAQQMLRLHRQSLLPFIPLMDGKFQATEQGAKRLAHIPNEETQRELSLHFLVLGGLRYNPEEILDLIGRSSMIPIEQLRESSFYQYIVKEGLKEGREKGLKLGLRRGEKKGLQQGLQQGLQEGRERMVALLKSLVAQKFPRLKLSSELDSLQDLAVLQQLCLEVATARSAKTVLKKINQAIADAGGTENAPNNK